MPSQHYSYSINFQINLETLKKFPTQLYMLKWLKSYLHKGGSDECLAKEFNRHIFHFPWIKLWSYGVNTFPGFRWPWNGPGVNIGVGQVQKF